jgi:hypothetical protein
VALFLWPAATDISLTLGMLQLFGDTSTLKTNVQKSNVLPIHCSEEDMDLIHGLLPCEILDLDCHSLFESLQKSSSNPLLTG